jgi:PAS domain S-box-containing protein
MAHSTVTTSPIARVEGHQRAIVADRDGVIRRWDSECVRVFGYTSEEALGHKLDLIVPPVLQARHWRGFNKAVNTGQLKRPGATLKIPAVHKSGTLISVQLTDATLARADDGSVDRVTLTLLGQGPWWAAVAWRAVLVLLKAGQVLRRS